jgi:hypothetical protein
MIDRELISLSRHVSTITINLPDSSENDDLRALVDNANKPPVNLRESQHNLDILQAYILSVRQKETAKSQEEEGSKNKSKQHSRTLSERFHGLVEALSPSMKKVFDVVLKVLHSGILQAVTSIACELTFQTHYEIAFKAIMLFITVRGFVTLHQNQDVIHELSSL